MQGDKLSPLHRYVRSLGSFYLISEVSAVLDVSTHRLRRLARDDRRLGPSAKTNWAGGQVWLYTAGDVTRIQEHLAQQPAKRVSKLWGREEYADRQRRDRLVRYYRNRAKLLADAGKANRAAQARRKAQKIADQLEAERARRQKQQKGATARRGGRSG